MKGKLTNYLKVLMSGGEEERPAGDRLASGMAAYEAGDAAKAAMDLAMGLVDHPEHLPARIALARIALGERKFPAAEQQATAAASHHPRDPRALTLLGEVMHAQRKYSHAESAYKGAINLAPKFAEAYVRLGILQFDAGDMTDAMKTLEKAITMDGRDANARYYIAQICLEYEDFKRALIQSHWAEKLDPSFKPIYLLRADIFEHLGDWRNAASELHKLDDMGMADADILCRMGVANLKQGQKELAQRSFQRAIEVKWHCLEARFHLAQLHEEQQQLELALNAYQVLANSKTYADASKAAIARISEKLKVIADTMAGEPEPEPEAKPGGKTKLSDLVGPRPGPKTDRPAKAPLAIPPRKASAPLPALPPKPQPKPLPPPPEPRPVVAEAPPAAVPEPEVAEAARQPQDARAQMLQMQLVMAMFMEMNSNMAQEGEAEEG